VAKVPPVLSFGRLNLLLRLPTKSQDMKGYGASARMAFPVSVPSAPVTAAGPPAAQSASSGSGTTTTWCAQVTLPPLTRSQVLGGHRHTKRRLSKDFTVQSNAMIIRAASFKGARSACVRLLEIQPQLGAIGPIKRLVRAAGLEPAQGFPPEGF
jgi:hypothetical protein